MLRDFRPVPLPWVVFFALGGDLFGDAEMFFDRSYAFERVIDLLAVAGMVFYRSFHILELVA
jgi:hypothetical protein